MCASVGFARDSVLESFRSAGIVELPTSYCALSSTNRISDTERLSMRTTSRASVSAEWSPDIPVCLRARLTDPKTAGVWCRTGRLTPYLAEMVVEDALHVGSGAHLAVAISPRPSGGALTKLQQQLAWIAARGVRVTLEGDGLAAVTLPRHVAVRAARLRRRCRASGPAQNSSRGRAATEKRRHGKQRSSSTVPRPTRSRSG